MTKTALAAAIGLAIALASGSAMAGKDLDAIKARGAVICGVPTGIAAVIFVSMKPGATALIVCPFSASTGASVSTVPITPAFDAA